MALVINDRVKETSTTTGTGTFSLAGAATGFETFVAGIATGNTTYYAIFNQGTTEWEVGLGTVTDATPDTLSRTTIYSSSNSDSAVDFAGGTKDVFCTLPASRTVYLNASGGGVGALAAVVDDTSPQLGGDLDLNSQNLDFPTVTNISDCLDEDTMSSDSATSLATQQSIKAYADSISGSDITTEGEFFSNYTNITGDLTTTLTTAKNRMIIGPITVNDTYTWDIAGTGTLSFI
jgi:hypothetical protein